MSSKSKIAWALPSWEPAYYKCPKTWYDPPRISTGPINKSYTSLLVLNIHSDSPPPPYHVTKEFSFSMIYHMCICVSVCLHYSSPVPGSCTSSWILTCIVWKSLCAVCLDPRFEFVTVAPNPSIFWRSTSVRRMTISLWRCTNLTPSSMGSQSPTWMTCWRTSRCVVMLRFQGRSGVAVA